MASRYRALLIGNSTYPADEHNLQPLKGPVKDIAVLNRALVDRATGLFADTDVSLLPETSSARAIRALGRFFGEANRDDVLLVYFSGHGKLDQGGRLHLCMQDTESTDLLATAVSSARINEFADESRARNIVIVLDCCFSGAFRGSDLGDAVAGPGRYVLTSCRGTQLANDATAENSTSYFTQHLVDGLLGAATDHDGDGYVTFSELYAYVDRRLRATGKQIPQRRVQGDGDLRLARREQPAPLVVSAQGPGPERLTHDGPAGDDPVQAGPATGDPAPGGSSQADPAYAYAVMAAGRPVAARAGPQHKGGAGAGGPAAPATRGRGWRAGWSRRTLLLAAAVIAAAAAGGGIAAALTGNGGNPFSTADRYTYPTTFAYTTPFQIKIDGSNAGNGCDVWLINARSGALVRQVAEGVYGQALFQANDKGPFKWQATDSRCQVELQQPKPFTLPLDTPQGEGDPSDTPVFLVHGKVAVQITTPDFDGSCDVELHDAVSEVERDSYQFESPQRGPVTLDPGSSTTAYVWDDGCSVKVTNAS